MSVAQPLNRILVSLRLSRWHIHSWRQIFLVFAGMDKDAVLIATALGGGLVTIAMGLFVNYPIALAQVGLLGILLLYRSSRYGRIWQTALGAVFISVSLSSY